MGKGKGCVPARMGVVEGGVYGGPRISCRNLGRELAEALFFCLFVSGRGWRGLTYETPWCCCRRER